MVPYCPHLATARQFEFLNLDCQEAFYGGAAGGGKTDALLMGALQYVHIPGYSALILRRDFSRLNLPGAIMDRAKSWLANTDVRWNGDAKTFRFPSGAVLQFGYIDNPDDRFRYASSEFQYIAFDELTEFRLGVDEANPYLFLFSRLRKTTDIDVPLRVRSASNPGNIGHSWVKNRFIEGEQDRKNRVYIPAKIEDNPALNKEEYEQSLMHLPPVTRARLMAGDWSIQEDSVIRLEWLRYYSMRGQIIVPEDYKGNSLPEIEPHQLSRFATIDTAGTSKERAAEKKGKPPSWSVCAIWDYHQDSNWLFSRHVWRERVDWTGLKEGVRQTLRDWQVPKTYIENGHVGAALHSEISGNHGPELVPTRLVSGPGQGQGAKLERAIASGLLTRLETGGMFLPRYNNDWLPELESEWLSWSGDDEETADQIDVASYAAWICGPGGSNQVVQVSGGITNERSTRWTMGNKGKGRF